MAASPEQFVTLAPDSKICYQTFGRREATPILLLSGGGQSMLSWHEDFIAQLLEAKEYFIIRYDIRDTGRSTHFALLDGEKSQYTLSDLCDDALAVLDTLSLQSAHFVGFSLGGGIAWTIAARHPDRVRSLVLISSSPVGPAGDDDIPGMDPELGKRIAGVTAPSDWHDQEQAVRFEMAFASLMTPRLTPDVEKEMRNLAECNFDRVEQGQGQLNSFFNQSGAAWPKWPRRELAKVHCPTVVLHGKLDMNVPLRHGEVLAEEIKVAELVVLDVGHEMPRSIWPSVVGKIVSLVN